jgi:hypothetical protein
VLVGDVGQLDEPLVLIAKGERTIAGLGALFFVLGLSDELLLRP